MAKPKIPPPDAKQVGYVRDAWSILLHEKASIAQESGLSLQQVVGLIQSHGHWSKERARRQREHDSTLAAQGEECTKRQMRAALAATGAYAIAAEKAERGMVESNDPEDLEQWRKVLPPFRDLHHVERVNTGRPEAIAAISIAAGDDRTKSLLDRAIERCREEGLPAVPTEPFPGEGLERPKSDPTKGDL